MTDTDNEIEIWKIVYIFVKYSIRVIVYLYIITGDELIDGYIVGPILSKY